MMLEDHDGKDLVYVWNNMSWNYRINELRYLLYGRWVYPFETLASIHANYILGKDTTNNFWEWLDNDAVDGGFNY